MPLYETKVTLKGKLVNEEVDFTKHTEMLINLLKQVPELKELSTENKKSYYGHWVEIKAHIDMFGSLSGILKKVEEGAPYNILLKVSRDIDAKSFDEAQKIAYEWLCGVGDLLKKNMNLEVSIK